MLAAALKVTVMFELVTEPAFEATVLADVVTERSSAKARSVPVSPIPYSDPPDVTVPSDTSGTTSPPVVLNCPSAIAVIA